VKFHRMRQLTVAILFAAFSCAVAVSARASSRSNSANPQDGQTTAQPQNKNKVMGRVDVVPATKAAKSAGVWVDGQYVGHVGELKGDKKVMLLPGDHEVIVREAGYLDLEQKITVEPGGVNTIQAQLQKDPNATYPSKTDAAEVKLKVQPDRAAVFVDGKFVGYVHEFGGVGRAMLVTPGKHQIKVALVGYKDFTADVSLHTGEKYTLKTDLQTSSVQSADPSVKQQ
jgi:PEGA domain